MKRESEISEVNRNIKEPTKQTHTKTHCTFIHQHLFTCSLGGADRRQRKTATELKHKPKKEKEEERGVRKKRNN